MAKKVTGASKTASSEIESGTAPPLVTEQEIQNLAEAVAKRQPNRFELIRKAYFRSAFRDPRLMTVALSILDDGNADLLEFVALNVLPAYGKAILPELRKRFDPSGGLGNGWRLVLMHQLDPDGIRPYARNLLHKGGKDLLPFALRCLGASPEDVPHLIEQTQSRSEIIRGSALQGLNNSNSAEAVKTITDVILSDQVVLKHSQHNSPLARAMQDNRQPDVLKCLLAECRRTAEIAIKGPAKDAKRYQKEVARFDGLLTFLQTHQEPATNKLLLDLFALRPKILKIKASPSGSYLANKITLLMSKASPATQRALVDGHLDLDSLELGQAFAVALKICKPKEVFDLFSGYFTGQGVKKKDLEEKRDSIKSEFYADEQSTVPPPQYDPRWLELALKSRDYIWIRYLVKPGDAKINAYFSAEFAKRFKSARSLYNFSEILDTMIRIQHPDAADAVMQTTIKYANSTFGLRWIAQAILGLPTSDLPKLEAWLATLPKEKAKHMAGSIKKLRQKAVS